MKKYSNTQILQMPGLRFKDYRLIMNLTVSKDKVQRIVAVLQILLLSIQEFRQSAKNLCFARTMMDVPVVAASRFEGHIGVVGDSRRALRQIGGGDGCQITVTDKVLGIGGVGLPFRPYAKINFLCIHIHKGLLNALL